ncbi:AI-2E family transporter [Lentibacillus sp. L22]|uniref:AI-2E family transporter n=1 Tax=Lentibacillus sp. L22 TaxID=3163028 RepID=UPI003466EDD6
MKTMSRFMKFIGGRDLIYGLILLILIGITIGIYYKIQFIFHPVAVILSTVVPPIILAFIAYYLLNPIVNLLERIHIRRIWGIIIIILALIGVVTGVVLLSAPAVSIQVKDMAKSLPEYLKQMGTGIESWVRHSFLAPYYDEAHQWVTQNLNDIPNKISSYLGGAVEGLRNVASTVTNIVVAIFTFPFVLFFLLKDGKKFRTYCLKLLPPSFRRDANEIIKNMDVQVGSYIQGQIIVATCIGILLYTGYLIIGLEYAITLAILAAVLSVVPYLGPIIAISPAIIIAIVDSPFMLLKLAAVWAVVQFLEGHFISPNIMGRTMKIHPLTIIFVLLCAGNLFGIVGVILGIPGYAILKVIVSYLFHKFKHRYDRYYGEDHGFYEANPPRD